MERLVRSDDPRRGLRTRPDHRLSRVKCGEDSGFNADLHAGSGWDRNIACALEHREVKKGIRSRAVQRHEAELLVEAEPTHSRGPDHGLNLSSAQAPIRLPFGAGEGKWGR